MSDLFSELTNKNILKNVYVKTSLVTITKLEHDCDLVCFDKITYQKRAITLIIFPQQITSRS